MLQEKYGFKAVVYKPAGFENKQAYKAVHGVDLPIRDIEEYDRICKVSPIPISPSSSPTLLFLTARDTRFQEATRFQEERDARFQKALILASQKTRDPAIRERVRSGGGARELVVWEDGHLAG